MTTERTYHDLTIAELRELALKNASPHTPRHERELSAMMLGHAMLAVLPHLAELEAENARLQTLWTAVEGLARHPGIGRGLYAHVVSADVPAYAKLAGYSVNEDNLADALIALAGEAVRK